MGPIAILLPTIQQLANVLAAPPAARLPVNFNMSDLERIEYGSSFELDNGSCSRLAMCITSALFFRFIGLEQEPFTAHAVNVCFLNIFLEIDLQLSNNSIQLAVTALRDRGDTGQCMVWDQCAVQFLEWCARQQPRWYPVQQHHTCHSTGHRRCIMPFQQLLWLCTPQMHKVALSEPHIPMPSYDRFVFMMSMQSESEYLTIVAQHRRYLGTLAYTPFLFTGSMMTLRSSRGTSLRPDGMLLTGDGRMLFKWEEKGASLLQVPIEELGAKTAVWTPLYYGQLPYLLCFAAAGPLMQFCAVERGAPGRAITIGPTMDLSDLRGRAQAVIAVINLYRLLVAARAYLPSSILPVGRDIVHQQLGFTRTL